MRRGAATLLATLAAACGGYGGAAPEDTRAPGAAAGSDAWDRRVDPFPVLQADGSRYGHPFLGGFNVPRPQLVDIDADGDLDLFIQEETDRLMFFERGEGGGGNPGPAGVDADFDEVGRAGDGTGADDGPRWRWRPDRFRNLGIGEWYRFVDVDGDGDRDLLAERPFSYVRLYRNVGDAGAAEFELIADTLRDTRRQPIFSDRQNIPNAADIDCDGLLDLFIGRLVGTVTRYEATGAIGATASPFRHVTDRFEDIEIVADPAAQGGLERRLPIPPGAPPPPPTLHGANTMALADVDGDGDVDLFWGDFFEPGLLFIENVGSCESPNLRTRPRPFPLHEPIRTSGYNAPTFGDVDGDGDLDLVMGVLGGAYNANTTTADNLFLFLQGEEGRFDLASTRLISQVDVGSESVPVLVDLDGDGDLDLLLGNKIDPDDLGTSRMFLFENAGDPGAPSFRARGAFPIEGAYHNVPTFGDLDADGDLDIVLGTWRSELRLLINEGSPTEPRFRLADSAFVELTRGSNATPTLGDIDSDGDLDLLVGESSGTINFYANTGTAVDPRFELVSDEYEGIDVGRRSFPVLVDADGDGDLDLAIGTEADGIVFYRNDGSPESPRFVRAPGPFPPADALPVFATPAFGDMDGDGDLDLVVGGLGGGAMYFERR